MLLEEAAKRGIRTMKMSGSENIRSTTNGNSLAKTDYEITYAEGEQKWLSSF